MTFDLRELLADIDLHLTEIRRDLQPALNSLAGRATTGFPTHTGTGHTSGGDTANPTLTAIANANGDRPHRNWSSTAPHPDRARLNHALLEATRQLATARGIIHRHTPPAEATPDDGDPGCNSCARIGQWMPRHRGDLCRWCYDWRDTRSPGDKGPPMPAVAILRAHHRGEPITNRTLEKAGVRR